MEICDKNEKFWLKMESTTAVILLFVCMAYCFSETSAKTNTAGHTDLNGDFNELSSNELSTEIDSCHDACLQKVCLLTDL